VLRRQHSHYHSPSPSGRVVSERDVLMEVLKGVGDGEEGKESSVRSEERGDCLCVRAYIYM
jgi:hypothetical protein